jgi:hypothetical protein
MLIPCARRSVIYPKMLVNILLVNVRQNLFLIRKLGRLNCVFSLAQKHQISQLVLVWELPYFLIDNAHPSIFTIPLLCIDNAHTPTSGRVRKYRQRTDEFFKSTFTSGNIEFELYGFE